MAALDLEHLGGKLLIAMPGIGDDRFDHAVILVCSHGPDHAMGLVLNKTIPGLSVPGLLEQLDIPCEINLPRAPVLNGGPVGRERGFVLHSDDYISLDSTLEVSDGLCLTATREILHAIGSRDSPAHAVLALGYAGWGEGQLEMELRQNVWLVADPSLDIIYGTDHDGKWQAAVQSLGISPAQLYTSSGRA